MTSLCCKTKHFVLDADGTDWFFRIFFTVAVLMILLGFGGMLLSAGDQMGTKTNEGVGKVVSKEHYPPLTGFAFHFSDKYKLCVQVADDSDCVDVTQEQFYSTPVGTQLKVEYLYGRLSTRFHIVALSR